jgi:hypothetical protein
MILTKLLFKENNVKWFLKRNTDVIGVVDSLQDAIWFLEKVVGDAVAELKDATVKDVSEHVKKIVCTTRGYLYDTHHTKCTFSIVRVRTLERALNSKSAPSFEEIRQQQINTDPLTRPPTPCPDTRAPTPPPMPTPALTTTAKKAWRNNRFKRTRRYGRQGL